jgi:hypothetical protein
MKEMTVYILGLPRPKSTGEFCFWIFFGQGAVLIPKKTTYPPGHTSHHCCVQSLGCGSHHDIIMHAKTLFFQ